MGNQSTQIERCEIMNLTPYSYWFPCLAGIVSLSAPAPGGTAPVQVLAKTDTDQE